MDVDGFRDDVRRLRRQLTYMRNDWYSFYLYTPGVDSAVATYLTRAVRAMEAAEEGLDLVARQLEERRRNTHGGE